MTRLVFRNTAVMIWEVSPESVKVLSSFNGSTVR